MTGNQKRKIGLPGLIASGIALAGLILVIVEGLASFALVARDAMRTYAMAERQHTKYDPDLGWMNEPNAYIPDMYGPGVSLKTNAQGFRNNQTIDDAVSDGKARVICSGDSFTLGYGVDDDHTWCQLLSSLNPRLESVNMGQGGYGVDQAYLWYRRDAARIDHQVHLLAFITHDFYRMQLDSFRGYPKPVLDLENGALVVKNAPVPRRGESVRWISERIPFLNRLRTAQVLSKGILTTPALGRLRQRERNDKTREVLRKIFEDLKRINEERSRALVLVYLPTLDELKSGAPKEWREFLEDSAQTLGIPLLNLFGEFQSVPYAEIDNLFIQKGRMPYYRAEGHYSVRGNELVARTVYKKIINHPALSCALSVQARTKSPQADSCRAWRSGNSSAG